jgi:hypothetical protein
MEMGFKSRGSSVGIATGYGLDDRCSEARFPTGAGNFPFIAVSRPALGPNQPPIQWIPGGAVFLGIKQPGREADHSPPSIADVNAWSYISTFPHVFMAWCLVKQRGSFTLPWNVFMTLFIYEK